MRTKKSNPNGANQHSYDPRQKYCWDLYINPKSETFSNGYKSALKAGYEENTAAVITTLSWFKEKLSRMEMLSSAEKVFKKTLAYDTEDENGKVITDLLRIQNETAKFVAKTQGKDEGYSEKIENEHSGNVTVTNEIVFKEQA